MTDSPEELPGQEQLEFFDRVWGTDGGFVEIEQRRLDVEGNRTGPPTEVKSFRWPMERERIGRYVDSRLDQDLYYAVPLYSKSSRQLEHVKLLNVVYVDDDGTRDDAYRLPPTFYVETSPGHKHPYWQLDRAYDPHEVARVGREISTVHRHDSEAHELLVLQDADIMAADPKQKPHKHCGTDPGGWDLTQILRVPGTLNTKGEYGPGFSHRIELIEVSGTIYTLEQLTKAYPISKETAQSVVQISDAELPADIPNHVDLLAQLGARPDLIDLWTNEPTGRGDKNGWDERLFALENALFRLGLNEREVYSLAWTSACNKFRRGVRNADGVTFSPRPNPELDLWRDVRKAAALHMNHESTWVGEYTPPTEDGDRAKPTEPERFSLDLITVDERAGIADRRTFIDRYVEWAASKTDASQVFHEAMAFTLLSTVLGEYGHARPKFGKLRLNMWFLVMGTTTRARKSTSRDLGMSILKGLSVSDWTYTFGGRFTAEGLQDALAERPRRSTLVHRDEVQGLFKEIASKPYMMGLNDTLTDLYGGKLERKMLAGGLADLQAMEEIESNFLLFFMGVVGKITSVLKLEDFESGFLARFIHVIGDTPERTKESEWLDQASPEEIAQGDPVYSQLVLELMRCRAGWHKLNPDRITQAIYFHEDAWKRWNDANWDLQQSVMEHDRSEILEASFDRLGKSALKAAALIAMSDNRGYVSLEDVIIALKYTGQWATHIVRSAEMVTESFWKKDLRELHDIVLRKGGTMKWEDAYSKMDKTPMEFKNIVEGATMSSLIQVRPDENRNRWLEAL